MANYDIVIVRPYVSFPGEGGGIDRYITLHTYAKDRSLKSLLCVSSFHHNKKIFRNDRANFFDHIKIFDAGGYKSNLSFKRIYYEFIFSYKVFSYLKNISFKCLIVGEPLFFFWFFLLYFKISRRSVKFYGDFIDLMPEAYRTKIDSHLFFSFISLPFIFSRWVKANLFYDWVITVSSSYSKIILNKSKKNFDIIYWGCNPIANHRMKSSSRQNLVYAGSLGEGYDIETLIDLGRLRPDIKIVIAGAGPKAILCQVAHEKGYISYLGLVGKDVLSEIYLNSDIGLLPYCKNSAVAMPIKFFEYITHRLKIINSLGFECSEIIDKFKLGCNYIPGDVISLSSALDSAKNLNPDYRDFAKLEKIFSVEHQYSMFVDVIIRKLNA